VADIDERAVVVLREMADRRAVPAHLARRRRSQPAQDANEARLAAAVRPGDAQRLAAGERERELGKEPPCAALAGEAGRLEH